MNPIEFEFTEYCGRILPSSLKESWNELLASSNSNTLFLTWEWMNTWCETYGDRYDLLVISAHDRARELLAIAPFKLRSIKRWPRIDGISRLEFIGWGERVTPEYLDIIVKPGMEGKLLPQLFDYLLTKRKIGAIDLKPFNPASGNLAIIESYLKKKSGLLQKIEHSECPVVSLPSNWDAYMSAKSKNFRKKMKEYERVCNRDLDFHVQLCNRHRDIDCYFENFVNLHQNRWEGKSEAFLSKKYLEFHRKVIEIFLENGWLRLFIAFDGVIPIGGIYCFAYNKQYHYYQSGRNIKYDKYRIGLVLINHAIKQAIGEGAGLFDFLTGREAYKFRWAERTHVNFSLSYYRFKKHYLMERWPRIIRSVGKRIVNVLRDRN